MDYRNSALCHSLDFHATNKTPEVSMVVRLLHTDSVMLYLNGWWCNTALKVFWEDTLLMKSSHNPKKETDVTGMYHKYHVFFLQYVLKVPIIIWTSGKKVFKPKQAHVGMESPKKQPKKTETPPQFFCTNPTSFTELFESGHDSHDINLVHYMGWAWVSTTLAGVHCACACICLFACT